MLSTSRLEAHNLFIPISLPALDKKHTGAESRGVGLPTSAKPEQVVIPDAELLRFYIHAREEDNRIQTTLTVSLTMKYLRVLAGEQKKDCTPVISIKHPVLKGN